MVRKLALLSAAICIFGNGLAQNKKAAENNSLLWKISGKNLAKPSYLFGTIHIICKDDYVWTEAMQAALDSSKKVVFEMDMDEPGFQEKMTAGLMLPEGKTLKDFYTGEEYGRLDKATQAQGLPLGMFQKFSPFGLVSLLYIKASGCMLPESYEGNIMQLAQQNHREILGLESIGEQLQVVNGMDKDSLAKGALRMAESGDSLAQEYSGMVALYKKQNLPELYDNLLASPDYKNDLDGLLYNRNAHWVPEIEKLVHQDPVFIAVGAAHLWGDKGVIALLRKQGYTLTPVH
ncbi:MAG: TraB/GumN family protein [Edaphocola sp.]